MIMPYVLGLKLHIDCMFCQTCRKHPYLDAIVLAADVTITYGKLLMVPSKNNPI